MAYMQLCKCNHSTDVHKIEWMSNKYLGKYSPVSVRCTVCDCFITILESIQEINPEWE